jgi:hypothetical protein
VVGEREVKGVKIKSRNEESGRVERNTGPRGMVRK